MAEEFTIVRAFPRVANVLGSRSENTSMRSRAAMTTPYFAMIEVIVEPAPPLGTDSAAEPELSGSGLLSDGTTASGVAVELGRRSIS
ncbi:hypothetical protein [Pseudonocardia sp. GCM10023141]|uniref:hypothetical protein n=1 Tax=Pseudonocardia sp. GCM10023141 TaxID=3252653 RepID=UPI0036239A38